MPDSLFRHEAVASQGRLQQFGRGSGVPPPAHWLGAAMAALVLVAIGCLLYFGTYTGSERVRGYLEPDAGTRRVFVPRTGIVTELLVDNGTKVSKGTPLLRLSAARPAHGISVDAQLIAALDEELVEIIRRLERSPLRQQLQRESIAAKHLSRTQALLMMEAQLELQAEVTTLGEKRLFRSAELASRGHLSAQDLQERRSATLLQQQAYLELQRKISELRTEIDSQAALTDELWLRQQDERSELQAKKLRLEAELAAARGAAAFTLTAAAEGTISGLDVRPGDRVQQTTPVLTLIPPHARFRAVLLVPSRARGLLSPGDEVRVRVDAFPYQTYGVVPGRISAVSQSPLLPGENRLPVAVTEASYRVDVSLIQQSLRRDGKNLSFAPGMTVVAEMLRERQRIYEWLLAPLLHAAQS